MPIALAEPKHLPDLLRLYTTCMRAMRAGGIEQWGDDYPTSAIIEKDVRDGSLHILEEMESILASICLNETQAPEYQALRWQTPEPILVVHRLCVDPARQRGGLGNQMMDFAEDFARQEGYAGIRLDTYSNNPAALRLYERRGYCRTGEVRFRGRSLPFYCFEKALSMPPRAPRTKSLS